MQENVGEGKLRIIKNPVVSDRFLPDLLDGLGYLKNFTASFVIFHLFDSGIYDALFSESLPAEVLAERLNLKLPELRGLLEFARVEGLIERGESGYLLTERLRSFEAARGWFTLFVGGYTETLQGIGSGLKAGNSLPTRNLLNVGVGSCEMSRYGAFPLVRALAEESKKPMNLILDLGCGSCLYLATFCELNPAVRAVGIEPSSRSVELALSYIKERGLEDRISVVNSDAITFMESYRGEDPDFIVFAFVLHEILGQDGEDALVDLLRSISRRFPNTNMIVIEVDHSMGNDAVMRSDIGRLFYNSYYLFHEFTEQQLMPAKFWKELFPRCGYEIVTARSINPKVDPQGLEMGFLLRPK